MSGSGMERPEAVRSTASTTGQAVASAPGISIPAMAAAKRDARHEPAAAMLGLRAHSGWAALVAVSSGQALWRRRIDMSVGAGEGPCQPYHAAAEMSLQQAVDYLQSTEAIAVQRAAGAVREAVATLASDGYEAARAAVLLGSGRPLPELTRILAAHPLIHTAEGVFFRSVLQRACEVCGLTVVGIPEREVLAQCAAALRISDAELKTRLAAMGQALGPPWTQDEKLCVAAALAIP